MADTKWSQFPSASDAYADDEVVGLKNGQNVSFSFAKILALVRQNLSGLFVPTSQKGVADGVASLDGTGKVPSTQLPPIASTAEDVTYDNTQSGLVAEDVQEAIDELAAGAGGGGVDPETIAPVEESSTATMAHPLGTVFYINNLLYRALADIPVGGTINTAAGGNATRTSIAQNFKRTVTLTSAEYAQLSAAEKAADIVYIITDDNTIPAEDVIFDPATSGLTATNVQEATDELAEDKAAKADLTNIQATGTTNTTGAVIPAGAYFYLNGILYRAKEQIGTNVPFTVNTNCEQTTVVDRLVHSMPYSGTTGNFGQCAAVLPSGRNLIAVNIEKVNGVVSNNHGWSLYGYSSQTQCFFVFNMSNGLRITNASITATLYYV